MNFANPVFVYASIWLTVLMLHSLRLLAVLVPANPASVFLIISTCVIFLLLFLALRLTNYAGSLSKPNHDETLINREVNFLEQTAKGLLIAWMLGTILTIVYSGGVPLYWMLKGSGRDYRDFGIPTFGGFIAAINTFLGVSYYILYHYKRRKKFLILMILMLLWPILVVSRGNFTYMLLEIVGAYLIINKGRLRTFAVMLVGLIAFVYIFGVIGDFRLGIENAAVFKKSILNQQYVEIADYLPSGLLYVYAYVTTPFNNVVYNIENLIPTYIPYYSTIFLLPSVVRGFFFTGGNYALEMVSETFNTFTFFAGYLKDFGLFFTIMIVTIIQGGSVLLYFKAMQGRIAYILAYSVAFQCLVLSVFNDNFTMQMSIFQIIYALYLGIRYKKMCKLNHGTENAA